MPTLRAFRRDLALKASSFRLVTTGVLYDDTYQGAPSGSDAARRIVSSDLGHANLAGTAAEIPGTAHDFQWVYAPDTAEQRRVVKNGYAAYNVASDVLTGQNASADALVVGYLTLDRALAAALPVASEAEILGRFPAFGYEESPGLHWALNEALAVIHWPRKVSISGDGTSRIDVSSTYAWLKRPEQLVRVFRTDGDDGYGPQTMAGKAWLEPDGDKVYLHIPERVASGESFSAQVRMPALNWIRVRRAARVSVTVTAGAITAVTVEDGGAGYLSTDTLTATVTGDGSSASLTPVRTGDAITSVTIGAGGSGYVQATTKVTISDPTGTWAASTVGLVNDLDEALPDVDRVTAVAYWMLALRMSRRGPKPQQEEWQREAEAAAKIAAPFVQWPNEPPTPSRGLRAPRHPTGRGWRPVTAGSRRWP